MKQFDYNKMMKPNIAVHCKTEQQAINLLNWADSKGLKWSNRRSYLEETHYTDYGVDTCYHLYGGLYCVRSWWEENSFTILSYEDVLLQDNVEVKVEKKITQKEWVLEHLQQYGSISRNEALKEYITRLASIIKKLEYDGYKFRTEWETKETRFGTAKDYRYYLVKETK